MAKLISQIEQNFITYAFNLLSLDQLSQGQIGVIRDLLQQWVRWDILESLANYHSVVKTLFGILKNTLMPNSMWSSHAIAEEIFQRLSQDVHALHEQLVSIFCDSGSYRSFLALRGDLAQRLLDLLQDLLDSFPESSARPRLFKALVRLSRESGLRPTCLPLKGLLKVGQQVAAGGFGDIWKGVVHGQNVSVKMTRFFRDADVKAALQEFGREALIWRQLSHPNLLPFFGLYYLDQRLCLVSPWMSNGNVLEFLRDAPARIDRLSLILDVAKGLEYLHKMHVVHGDLKGVELVSPTSVCRLLLTRRVFSSPIQLQVLGGGTARYQAPELLMGETKNHFGSDVYAFACVCYEMLIGKVPYFEFPLDITQLVEPAIGAKTKESATDWDETISSRSRRSFQEWPLLPSIAAIEHRIFGDDVVAEQPMFFNKGLRSADLGPSLDDNAARENSLKEFARKLAARPPFRLVLPPKKPKGVRTRPYPNLAAGDTKR
ncbi:Protein kinase domain-containing protein [Mycena venus]|uniref:Protein kinase domain-containing protein n=1 Tax=Mycena venus TaxID=2733690 RepID=A0A8H6YFM9_9AGAR|nr:Protein kinase domain-containing protein [Mycena venus]